MARHDAGFRFVITCTACLMAAPLFGQPAAGKAAARVGVGVSISDPGELLIAGSDTTLAATIVPSILIPTILIPINLTSRFRLEPEVGGYRTSSTVTEFFGSASLDRKRMNSLLRIGTGAFGLVTKEKFTLYYGGRVAYLRYRQSSQTGSFPESFTYPSIPAFSVAPTVGGEYFFSDYLSFGGEVQVTFISWSADSVPRTSASIPSSISGTQTSTHGALVLRFYLPH